MISYITVNVLNVAQMHSHQAKMKRNGADLIWTYPYNIMLRAGGYIPHHTSSSSGPPPDFQAITSTLIHYLIIIAMVSFCLSVAISVYKFLSNVSNKDDDENSNDKNSKKNDK